MNFDNLNAAAQQLLPSLQKNMPDFCIEVYESIGSTNTELFNRARTGNTTPTILVAMQQTAGRGRQGKTWVNAPGDCLMFSMGLKLQTTHLSWIALLAGIAAAEALQSFDCQENLENSPIGIKWPNDLWLRENNHKLGGILIETVPILENPNSRYVIIGMGINIRVPKIQQNISKNIFKNILENPPSNHLPPPTPATALQNIDPRWTSSAAFLKIIPRYMEYLKILISNGPAYFMSHFEKLDLLRDRELHLHGANAPKDTFIAQGINALGQLQLFNPKTHEKITLHNTEFSLRPRSHHHQK